MPPHPRFRVPQIKDLNRQLLYAPADTRRRQLDAAEQLVRQIEPDRLYPQDFVIYRITGYRPDLVRPAVALVGEALQTDLITLIQRLSASLDLSPQDAGRRAVGCRELARRLNVSAKTIQRYRKQGLVCHYVLFPDGRKRLACFEDSLSRFRRSRERRIDRAAVFGRLSARERQSIILEADRLHRLDGRTLNAAARGLAGRHGRAHETVRSILRRHDRGSARPIFDEPGPLAGRDIRLIYRARRKGVGTARLARRFSKTRASIHRAINLRRGDLLRGLTLRVVHLPMLDRDDAESVILSAPAVTGGLDEVLGSTDARGPEGRLNQKGMDALNLIEAAHLAAEPDSHTEAALIGGYNLLKRRASRMIVRLGGRPASAALDFVETDLRWATLLKCRLVCLGLPSAVRAVEQTLHQPLAAQPSEEIRDLLGRAIEVTAECVEKIDPGRGQRLAHRCGFSMHRTLAVATRRSVPRRAATRHRPGSIRLQRSFDSLNPWQAWLELEPELAGLVGRLAAPGSELVTLRYGLQGQRPLRAAELAGRFGLKESAVEAWIRRSEVKLQGLRRDGRGI